MRYTKRLLHTLTLVILLSFLFPRPVYAYIDPGTGSIIIQVLIGSLVGGLAIVGIFWRQVTSFFKRLLSGGRKRKSNDD